MTGKRQDQWKLLWQEWVKYKEAKNAKSNEIEIQRTLKRATCKELARDVSRFRSSGDKEDGLYEQLSSLMGVYRGVLVLNEDNDSFSPVTKEIMLAFEKRLELYENEVSEYLTVGENPITKEKNDIMEAAIVFSADEVDKMYDIHDSVMENAQVINKLFSIYKESLRITLLCLGEIRIRKNARFFLNAFEREMGFLENLSQTKLSTLENLKTECDQERDVIVKITKVLRETPVFLVWFQNDFHSTEPPVDKYRSYTEFEKAINDELNTIKLKEPLNKEFVSLMDLEAQAMIRDILRSYLMGEYKLRQVVAADVLLTTEVIDTFTKTLGEMPVLTSDGDANETERMIASGIIETIEIKIESLNDSIQEYKQRADTIISSFAGGEDIIPEEMCVDASAALLETWISSPPEEEGIGKFFADSSSGEAFNIIKIHVDKKLTTSMENVTNNAFKYKKEVLLFEVCTYEEILTHSVSRLRSSNSEAVISAANVLNDTFDTLEVILRKNNIKMLRPVPHDQFNAKEHEVLVAEKQEGFTKGEIIKIVNSGYMYQDTIIIRANVIAAK